MSLDAKSIVSVLERLVVEQERKRQFVKDNPEKYRGCNPTPSKLLEIISIEDGMLRKAIWAAKQTCDGVDIFKETPNES